jgi:hypothetical protein
MVFFGQIITSLHAFVLVALLFISYFAVIGDGDE